jgi:hypothetical protein
MVAAIGAIAVGVWIARNIGERRRRLFLLLAVVWAIAINLAVHASRSGTLPAKELGFYKNEEILSDVLSTGPSPVKLLSTYTERQPTLSVHGRTKPPGFALLYQAVLTVFPKRLSILGIVITVLGSVLAIPVYWLARALDGDEARARASALLAASAPASVLFGAVSLDAVFAVVAATCFALTAWEIATPSPRKRFVLGFTLFVSIMLSYSGLVVGLVCALWLALERFSDPRRLLRSGVEIASGVVAPLLFLRWSTGFNAWTCFVNARKLNSDLMTEVIGKRLDTASIWSYASIGNLLAFGVFLGPALVAALGGLRASQLSPRARTLALAAGASLLVACIGGVYLLETERILLFFVPIVAVLAARSAGPKLAETVGLSCSTALLFELLCFTLW